jgi:hypothetical protein
MIDLLHLLPFAQVCHMSSSTTKEAAQPAVQHLQLRQQQHPSQKATCRMHSKSSSNAVITLTPLLLMPARLRGREAGLCLPLLLLLHLRPALERL